MGTIRSVELLTEESAEWCKQQITALFNERFGELLVMDLHHAVEAYRNRIDQSIQDVAEGRGIDFTEALSLLLEMPMDRKLDGIYDKCDNLMHAGKFDVLNSILSVLDHDNISHDERMGWLTATLPAKDKLPEREVLRAITRRELFYAGEPADEILKGL